MPGPSRLGAPLIALALACNSDPPDADGSTGTTSTGTTAEADTTSEPAPTSGDDTTAEPDSTTAATASDDTGHLVVACPSVNGVTVDGEHTSHLRTQAEIEMLAGCTHVAGSLNISSNGEPLDLAPLASLHSVGGSLTLSDSDSQAAPANLLSLVGLEGLESVRDLRLRELRVTDLGPLAGLTTIAGEVAITGLTQLASLEGLHNLTTVGTELAVTGCPQLVDLDGLRGLQHVGVRVWFAGLPITGLQGLEQLTEVGSVGGESRVGLYQLPQLTSLAGLAVAWRPEHDIRIYQTAITDLQTFAGVDELTALRVESNDLLTDLGGLESLTVVRDELALVDNDGLTDLGALTDLQSVGALTIEGSALTDLGPLPALTQPGKLRISGNEQLTSLSVLTDVTSLDSLVLEFNPKLAGLPELNLLTQVIGDLELRTNASMTALTDLPALTSVGGRLVVVYNPELLQTDAEAWGEPITAAAHKIVGNKGYDAPPLDPCPWADDGECDVDVCDGRSDGFDCLSD